MNPTKTTNRLHFEDLSFSRFEDMCVQVVYRMRDWSRIHHYGRKGKERGVDIYADIIEDGVIEKWFVQCKKYQNLTLTQLRGIIDDLIKNNDPLPDRYVIIVSCDISRATFEDYQKYALNKGMKNVDIIAASILETILYSKHPDLLYTFFGVSVFNQRVATVARIKRRLAMKHKIEKDFMNKKRGTDVIIRDVHRDIYPELDLDTPGISPWFKLEYRSLYHKGISLFLNVVSVAVSANGVWRLIKYDEKLPAGWIKINAFQIGNIPYDNIVDVDIDGDEYYRDPHLYCEFNNLGQPYEEIWYTPTDKYNKVVDSLPKDKKIS